MLKFWTGFNRLILKSNVFVLLITLKESKYIFDKNE